MSVMAHERTTVSMLYQPAPVGHGRRRDCFPCRSIHVMLPTADIARGAASMPVRIFLSTVSDEFRDYRDQLRHDLTRHNVEVKVQGDFKDLGTVTLDKLDVYITNCDAVVHLVGDMTGAAAKPESTKSMLAKYPNLPDKLPPLRQPLADGLAISYTQWEAWLALYHDKRLVIAKAHDAAPRGHKYRAEIAPRGRGLFAILPYARLRLRNGRRFFIRNRAKQVRGIFDVAGPSRTTLIPGTMMASPDERC